jgi:N-acetyltransferase
MELVGKYVALEPLGPQHGEGLVRAASEDRGSFTWAPVPRTIDDIAPLLASRAALAATGSWMSFATCRASDRQVLGSTSFLNIERWDWPHKGESAVGSGDELGPAVSKKGEHPDSAEIGATWLAPSAQRTAVNTEAKLLMLTHAFDVWGVQRLQIKTDARNQRSRDAIAGLGATFEGILRNYQAGQGDLGAGTIRSTAMFSIVPDEWPEVRDRLQARLAKYDS